VIRAWAHFSREKAPKEGRGDSKAGSGRQRTLNLGSASLGLDPTRHFQMLIFFAVVAASWIHEWESSQICLAGMPTSSKAKIA